MKSNRIVSFILIALVYIISSFVGIVVFNIHSFDLWINVMVADIAATLIVFIFSLIFKNASVYDPYWSVAPIVIVIYASIKSQLTVGSILVLIAVLLWGVRLTINWAYTFKDLNHQDWRYTMLKEKTRDFYPLINLFGIHLFPTMVVYFCIIPAVYLITMELEFNIFTIIFFITAVLSVIFQGISDYQMHKYRKNKETPFIRTGLWKYSRHPNYLGEILMWWSIGLLVVFTTNGMFPFLNGAIINTVMFLVVSIPMADKRQAKKEGFEQYKKETRALLPIKRLK